MFSEKLAGKTDVSDRNMEGNLIVLLKDTIAERESQSLTSRDSHSSAVGHCRLQHV